MKEEFPEYFLPSEEEFNDLWGQAYIVFDANFLLNLYLYGSSTRESLFADLSKLNERLWIPAQVAEEYLSHRVSKIEQQHDVYGNMYKWLTDITSTFEKLLGNVTRHPTFDKEPIRQGFNKAFKKIEKVIRDQEAIHETEFIQNINSDEVLNQLTELYKGKVGRRWKNDELGAIFKEGEVRYKNLVPPGYMDIGKDRKNKDKEKNGGDIEKDKNSGDVDTGERKYGDLILWKQLLEWSKGHDKPVIFVTEDAKEDWWLKGNLGRTIGPRPELIAEHRSVTGKAFYMYKPDVFWKYAREQLKSATNIESIEEIERVSKDQDAANYRLIPKKYYDEMDGWRLSGLGAIDTAKLLGLGTIDYSKLIGISGAIDTAKLLGLGGWEAKPETDSQSGLDITNGEEDDDPGDPEGESR